MQAFFMTLEDYLVEHPKVRTAWSTPNGLKLNSLNLLTEARPPAQTL
jgi:hypothetical protein